MKTDIVFLISAFPDYCPCCNESLKSKDQTHKSYAQTDFSAGCSFSCGECGAQYQKLTIKMENLISAELDNHWRKV